MRLDPLAPRRENATAAAARPRDGLARPPACRILLVEDDPGVREGLAYLLRAGGQLVTEAAGGAAGIAQLAAARFDLVLTDLGMPEVTGWDVARAAKARDPGLPVVLVTGWGDQTLRDAPGGVCIDGVLRKPVQLPALLGLVRELVRAPEPRSGA